MIVGWTTPSIAAILAAALVWPFASLPQPVGDVREIGDHRIERVRPIPSPENPQRVRLVEFRVDGLDVAGPPFEVSAAIGATWSQECAHRVYVPERGHTRVRCVFAAAQPIEAVDAFTVAITWR